MHSLDLLALNNFDYIISGIIFLSVLIAIVRGFIKSAISLTGWCIALVIGMKFNFLLLPILSKYIAFEALAVVSSAFVLFIISATIIAILNNLFYLLVSPLCGGLLDRSMGALFGFLRGCGLVCALFYVMLILMPQLSPDYNVPAGDISVSVPSWAQQSKTIRLLNRGANMIKDCVPLDFSRKLKMISSKEGHSSKKVSDKVSDPENRIVSILNTLPKEVLKRVSEEDLIMLQDTSASVQKKAKVLTDIKKLYEEYMDESTATLSNTEVNQRDLSYYGTMIMIEDALADYEKSMGEATSDIS